MGKNIKTLVLVLFFLNIITSPTNNQNLEENKDITQNTIMNLRSLPDVDYDYDIYVLAIQWGSKN